MLQTHVTQHSDCFTVYGDYIFYWSAQCSASGLSLKSSRLVAVMFMVVCLLFESSLSIQVSPSRPLAFSHGAAIAPLHYSRVTC